jgi:hypothetical protein
MEGGLAIGLGTAVLIGVLAVLLLRGRFARRPGRPRTGDPAAVWAQGDRSETPPERDMATRAGADDPLGPDGDGPDVDGPDGGGGGAGGGPDGP